MNGVVCSYQRSASGQLYMTVSGFSADITGFFQVSISNFISPRSTAPSDTFEFRSYDKANTLLDFQTKGIQITASIPGTITFAKIDSQSQIVANQNVNMDVSFKPTVPMITTDTMRIRIPKWNPKSRQPISAVNSDVNCAGTFFIRSNVNCTVSSTLSSKTFDILVFTNPFERDVSNLLSPAFQIQHMKNPISTSPQTGWVIEMYDQAGGQIATGLIDFQIKTPATIDSTLDVVSLDVSDKHVNVATMYKLSVFSPVPLDEGCQVTVSYPSDIKIGPEFSSVSISGLFGSFRQTNYTVDTVNRKIVITSACSVYAEGFDSPALFYFSVFTNPGFVRQTASFQVTFADVNGNVIAQTSGGMFFTPLPGTIYVQPWFAKNSLITTVSDVLFSIQPQNPLKSSLSQAKLFLPSADFEKMPSVCEIYDYNWLVDQTKINCTVDAANNGFTLDTFLRDPYNYDQYSPIEFGIKNILMPSSSRPTGMFLIQTFDRVNGTFYLVDELRTTNLLQALSGELVQLIITPEKNQTYTEDNFAFSFKASHPILKGGSIEIVLPTELTLTEDSACKKFAADVFEPTAVCVFDKLNGVVSIKRGFEIQQNNALDRVIKFTISSVFTTRSQKASGSFKVQTLDKGGYSIDRYNVFRLPPFQASLLIETARTSKVSEVVGEITTYGFAITSPLPLYKGDKLYLFSPPSTTLGLAYKFQNCNGDSASYLVNNLQCSLQGLNGVKITIDLKGNRTEIPKNTEFTFTVEYLANPGSTKPSQPFFTYVTDYLGYNITSVTNSSSIAANFNMHATVPAGLTSGSVKQEHRLPFKAAHYTFQITITHALPPQANILLNLPLSIEIDIPKLTCWVDSAPDLARFCTYDETTRNLKVFNVTAKLLFGGTNIQMEVGGMVNPRLKSESESFVVTTTTTDNFLIDQKTSGLTVFADCNYPCMSCKESDADFCYRCDTEEGSVFNLFFQNTCVSSCPSQFFALDHYCEQCSDECRDCAGSSRACTSCRPGTFLLGNKCLDVCPLTHFADRLTNTCLTCNSPCATCIDSRDFCLSCDPKSSRFLFFENQCYEDCPVKQSVNHQGQCQKCSSNCASCINVFDQCDTCDHGDYLDIRSAKCVETCPETISVPWRFDIDSGQPQLLTCEMCNETCSTCENFDVNLCTQCRENFKMMEETQECLESCPEGTAEIQVPLTNDIVCMACAEGCAECTSARNHCTVCKENFVFFQFSCLATCPVGFIAQNQGQPTPVCIRDGTVCPFGYVFNDEKVCILDVPHCNEGYILNPDRTMCIPVPGPHAPFVFLFASIIWCIFIMCYKKNFKRLPRETMITQILVGIILIQQLGYIVLLILAFQIDYVYVKAIHLLAMFLVYIMNAAYVIYFYTIRDDLPFNHWKARNPKTTRYILAASGLLTFKVSRLFYSKLFSKNGFDAALAEKYKYLAKPMFIFSMVCLLQAGPILFTNVYIIWMIDWGYEIKTLAIENILCGLFIFALEIYEFVLFRKHEPLLLGVRHYINGMLLEENGSGRKKASEVKVMAGFYEDLEDQDPDAYNSQKQLLKTTALLATTDNKNIAQAAALACNTFSKLQMTQGIGGTRQISEAGEGTRTFQEFAGAEASQVVMLNDLIKRIDEKTRIRELDRNFHEVKEDNDKTLDESGFQKKRIFTHGTSAKDRKKLLTEKRQRFELFRLENKRLKEKFEKIPDLTVDILSKPPPVAQPPKQKEKKKSTREAKHHGDRSIGDNSSDQVSEKKSHMSRKTGISHTFKKPQTFLEKYEARSDDEVVRDTKDFERFYEVCVDEFQRPERGGILVHKRLTQSFDEDVLREMYDGDFGVEDDFNSEGSWISFPPQKKFVEDPHNQAKLALFREKVKAKFNFMNVGSDAHPPKPVKATIVKPSRKTQTLQEQDPNVYFDPFVSDDDFLDDSQDQLSEIDPAFYQRIMQRVYDGFSDGNVHGSVHILSSKGGGDLNLFEHDDFFDSDDLEGNFGLTKKKKRDTAVRRDDLLGELLVDDMGNLRIGDHKMTDKNNKKVNKKGYLVDKDGNVTDKEGKVVFIKDEVDKFGEIPDPFCNEKRKKQILTANERPDLPLKRDVFEQVIDPDEILEEEEAKIALQMEKYQDLSMDAPSESDFDSEEENESDLEKLNQKREALRAEKLAKRKAAQADQSESVQRKKSKIDTQLERVYKPHVTYLHNQGFDLKELENITGSPVDRPRSARQQFSPKSGRSKSSRRKMDVESQEQPEIMTDIQMLNHLEAEPVEEVNYSGKGFKNLTGGDITGDQDTHGNISSSEVDRTRRPLPANQWDSEMSMTSGNLQAGHPKVYTVYPNANGEQQTIDADALSGQKMRTGYQTSVNKFVKGDLTQAEQSEREIQQTEDLNRRRKFDKTEHPSMFNLQNQRAHTPKMYSKQEDFEVVKRPVPFLPLGLNTKPYKAKKSRVRQKEMQQEADHRRAQMTCGTDRIKNLETIYLKNAATTKMSMTNTGRGTRSIPRPVATSEEANRIFSRHSSAGKFAGGRRAVGPSLRKQNFIEDGANILNLHQINPDSAAGFYHDSGLDKRASSLSKQIGEPVRVKHELLDRRDEELDTQIAGNFFQPPQAELRSQYQNQSEFVNGMKNVLEQMNEARAMERKQRKFTTDSEFDPSLGRL